MEQIKKYYKAIWWIILFISMSLYFFINYNRITSTPTSIDSVITLSLVIIVFMPLISEISILGLSIKKEINEVKSELRSELYNFKSELMNIAILSNTNNNSVYIGSERIPSEFEVKSKLEKGEKEYSNIVKEDKVEYDAKFKISEDNVFLFKARLTIENKVNELLNKYGIPNKNNLKNHISILRYHGIITISTEDRLLKVLSICNRGIHGEVIDKNYISYVRAILIELDEDWINPDYNPDLKMNSFVTCDRCGYIGNSFYADRCPNCGAILCD